MSEDAAPSGPAAQRARAADLVARMSVDEKAALCSGLSFWHLEANERLGVPSVMVTDGPHGLRKQATAGDHVGLNASVPATCFPTASALASSWDRDLLREIGVALGEQCVAENVTVLLGPGMNIKRHPLCGRNFEYFSEDPLVTGAMAAALVDGIQSQGVGASVKHFAANNQEAGRMFVDAIVDERTLREIYLRGFETVVRQSRPWTVMCSYNRLNGVYCGEHEWLLNRVLRNEWGFEGLVVTDWGAANDRVLGLSAGLDLEMPASGGVNDVRIVQAVRDGRLPEAELDRTVRRNVALSLAGAELEGRDPDLDQDAHHALARRAAAECTVLLKNAGGLLPLGTDSAIAVIGAFAREPRYQGAGSSQVTPTRLDCAFDAIEALVPDPTYAPGYDAQRGERDDALITDAVAAAHDAEGYLAGQAGGTAIADVLFGMASPGGKLAETFPLHQADVPADRWFPGSGRQVAYREGLYVGYRYFDSAAAPVLFPFGHGLFPFGHGLFPFGRDLYALRVFEPADRPRWLRPGRHSRSDRPARQAPLALAAHPATPVRRRLPRRSPSGVRRTSGGRSLTQPYRCIRNGSSDTMPPQSSWYAERYFVARALRPGDSVWSR